MSNTALERAIRINGGQAGLARKLGIAQGQVWYWLRKLNGRVPAEMARPIEIATSGKVTKEQLRPDIYPKRNYVADAPEKI